MVPRECDNISYLAIIYIIINLASGWSCPLLLHCISFGLQRPFSAYMSSCKTWLKLSRSCSNPVNCYYYCSTREIPTRKGFTWSFIYHGNPRRILDAGYWNSKFQVDIWLHFQLDIRLDIQLYFQPDIWLDIWLYFRYSQFQLEILIYFGNVLNFRYVPTFSERKKIEILNLLNFLKTLKLLKCSQIFWNCLDICLEHFQNIWEFLARI